MRTALLILLALTFGCAEPEPEPTCADLGSCEVGDACDSAAHCATGLCDGVCLQPCADVTECPPEQRCLPHAVEAGRVGACQAALEALGDLGDPCVDGIECRDGLCEQGVCTRLCTSCGPGFVCEPGALDGVPVGMCRWRPVAPASVLGPFDVPAEGSQPIAVAIPAGLRSFAIVVKDSEPGGTRRVALGPLIAPDQTVLEDGDLDYSDPNPAAIRYPDATSILVPNGDTSGPVMAGIYTIEARLFDIDFDLEDPWVPASGSVTVEVIYEWEDEAGGLLDLNVFVAPATGVSASLDDAYVDEVLAGVEGQLAGAGLALGTVAMASLPAEFDVVSDSDTVRRICREHSTPGANATAVNVFLVDRLEFALGFTGGTPSPPGSYGLAPSGVVVDAGGDPRRTAIVVAHEVAHFLGLRHTTAFNADGTVFATDPISDTPECESESQSCPDRANLMFPTIDFGQEHALTAGQFEVLSRSPLLYEVARPDLCAPWPARDVTQLRKAAGMLAATGTTEGSCGGAGGEVAHVLRVFEPTTVTLSTSGVGDVVYVRTGACDAAEELGCSSDGELTVELAAGEFYVFVDGAEGGAYSLRVD